MTERVTTGPEIVFNFAAGQNQFFVELAQALVHELAALGHPARIAHDEAPAVSADRVDVLTPPHEWVSLSQYRPSPAILGRCIGISAEQPESHFFYPNCELGLELGALFDINHRGVRAYKRTRVHAEHLQLGMTSVWHRSRPAEERDIDILFMGRATLRRERALARYAGLFERYRCHLQLADGSRPGRVGAADFLAGDAKRDLMSRSKLLLTLHGEDEPYFEWLRIVEAMCAGCLVVSEHSTDIAPFVPGEHLLVGGVERLGLITAHALDNPDEASRIRDAASELISGELRLAHAAARLADAAARIATQPWEPPNPDDQYRRLLARRSDPIRFDYQPPASQHSLAEGQMLRALKSQALSGLELRRRLARLEASAGGALAEPGTDVQHVTTGWGRSDGSAVTVIVPLYNHADFIIEALDSVLTSRYDRWELVVVDDASTDGGAEAVVEWMRRHDEVPASLVRHRFNRGLPHARNTGVEHGRGSLLFMLDADNLIRPNTLAKLVEALEGDPAAGFAYGILERFGPDGPDGLVSFFAWNPQRLRTGNYIDALSLIRRELLEQLDGYSTDARLHGWEDYDLWVRAAEAGHHPVFVPEIIARYRMGYSSMLSLSNISSADAFAAVADHAPTLMQDLHIPH